MDGEASGLSSSISLNVDAKCSTFVAEGNFGGVGFQTAVKAEEYLHRIWVQPRIKEELTRKEQTKISRFCYCIKNK